MLSPTGDSDVPHPCIGRLARRIPVPDRSRQQELLVEAVQNHNPQVVVIDEIGTAAVSNGCCRLSRLLCV